MKKLVMMALCAMCGMVFATESTSTDVYNFTMSGKVPYVYNGYRIYQTQTMKGYFYITYDDEGSVVNAYADVQNSKTKVNHRLVFDNAMFNLMGKPNKYVSRTVPTVCISGTDLEVLATKYEAHETIKEIIFAGTGSLKHYKTGTGCTACGLGTTSTCDKLYKLSGNFVGIMLCECPEELNWTHTMTAYQCGITDASVRDERAAYWGTWSISYNAKLTAAFVEQE